MKKSLITLILIVTIYMLIGYVDAEKEIIPKDAIRLRVIPNSNSNYDQKIKNEVKSELQNTMFNLLKNTRGINEARITINDNLNTIDNKINTVLKQQKYKLGYNLNYGYHYFPEKTFKGITYEAGEYESLLVTLGKGEGSNWWCVLFPPLCMLEADESDEIEYKSFVKELIDKYL